MLRKLGFGLTAMALMTPGVSSALGVGGYQLHSYLNQPLDMEITLHEVGDLSVDEILVNLASQDEFDSAGVDRSFFLNKLEFEVKEQSGDSAVLHVSSSQPVREPYLNFLVEFLWPTGRLMREYTVLLDPASYAEQSQVQTPTTERAAAPERATPDPVADRSQPAPQATQTQRGSSESPAAPSPTPSRPEPAATEERGSYAVKASDTMWSVALQNRPSESVSVQQMLVATQRLNPDAFINDNVNLVREGAVLRLPNEQDVRDVATRSAISEVARQNRQWQDMVASQKAQQMQKAPLDGSRQESTGESAEAGPDSGEVKLVTADSPENVTDGDSTGSAVEGDASAAALENELAIRDENLDRLDRQNSELQSRLADLEEQVETSSQLLSLRNDQITRLQEELRTLREEQGVAAPDNDGLMEAPPSVETTLDREVSETGSDSQQSETANQGAASDGETDPEAAATTADAAQDVEQSADTATTSDPETAQAQAIEEQAAPADAPAQDNSEPVQSEPTNQGGIVNLIKDNLLYLLGAVLVILLLLALLLRRRQAASADSAEPVPLADTDDDGEDFGLNLEDDGETGFDSESEQADGAQPTDDSSSASQDPLEEVEVYVAYGRYPQAVDFLRNEINQAPQHIALKVRLLELLHEMQDEDAFQQQAAIYAGTDPQLDAAIARLSGTEAPGSDDDQDDVSLDDLEMDLTSSLAGDSQVEPESDREQQDDAFSSLDVPEIEPESDASQHASTADQEDELADFDFQLDDGEQSAEQGSDSHPAPAADEADQAEQPSSEVSPYSELSDEDMASLDAEPVISLDDGRDEDPHSESTDDGEFSLDEISAEFTESDTPAAADQDEELDLSLDDLDLSDEDDGADQKPAEQDSLADLDLELDEAELSLEEPQDATATPTDQDGGDDISLDLPDLDDDEVATADALSDDHAQPLTDAEADLEPPVAADHLEQATETPEQEEASQQENEPSQDDPAQHEPALDLPEVESESEPVAPTDEEAPAVAPATQSEDDLLADEDDFDFLGETDENATKLDLAKAYIEMGDNEGARDILSEVVSEGDTDQQNQARELLDQVG